MFGKKPLGVKIFGALIVVSSLVHIQTLIVDMEWYFYTYSYLPHWLAVCRYSFSWFQRIFGLTAGIGIFFYRDVFRKMLLILGIFTITTVYWKHPYQGVKQHVLILKETVPNYVYSEKIVLASVIFLITLDVVFQGAVIYYFTRPSVKKSFKSWSKS